MLTYVCVGGSTEVPKFVPVFPKGVNRAIRLSGLNVHGVSARVLESFRKHPVRALSLHPCRIENTTFLLPLVPLDSGAMERPTVKKIPLSQCHEATGLVIVIDVLRAFTTAAYAFGAGAKEITLVSSTEEAFALKRKDPTLLLMGEENGQKISGFDFGNSPVEIANADLKGRRLVQRTSAGTQGVVRSWRANYLFTSSFSVAEATYKQIVRKAPKKVTFVITGNHNADEDMALADYLEQKLLKGKEVDPSPYLQRVTQCPDATSFLSEEYQKDVQAAVTIDRFPFAMKVYPGNVLRPYFPIDGG